MPLEFIPVNVALVALIKGCGTFSLDLHPSFLSLDSAGPCPLQTQKPGDLTVSEWIFWELRDAKNMTVVIQGSFSMLKIHSHLNL